MERLGSKFGRGKGVATVNGDVACEALISFHHRPRERPALMVRIAALSDIHGNLQHSRRCERPSTRLARTTWRSAEIWSSTVPDPSGQWH